MKFYLLQVNGPDSKPWFETYAGTIGTIVVILLFIVERIFSRRERRDERNVTWYFTVIVQPNLEIINSFFQNYSTKAVAAHTGILTAINGAIGIQLKATHFYGLQLLIKDFDFEFLMIVYGYEISRHSALMNIISEMHDEVVNVIDDPNISANSKENILQIIRGKKSLFFDTLSSGVININNR